MSRFLHMFRLAAPALAAVQFIALAVVVIPTVIALNDAERSANVRTAMLGDGVDELSRRFEPVIGALARSASGFGALSVVAGVSTLISLVAVGAHAGRVVRGPGDAGAVLWRAAHRIRNISHRKKYHVWGVVRDADSGQPVPFARVRLTTADGAQHIARDVSDAAGRYGFGVSVAQAADAGFRVSARKNAYYFPSRKQGAGRGDVLMDAAGVGAGPDALPTGKVTGILSGAAFWASVASVPLVASVLPHSLAALLIGGLGISVVGRIAGLGRKHS